MLTDLLPPDVTAATLEMLDALDVLRTLRAVLPTTLALPPGWEYQAHRPLREIEQHGFGVMGLPLRLWPTCPTLPDGLVCLYKNDGIRDFAVHDDLNGKLYVDLSVGGSPFHCWHQVDNDRNAYWRMNVLMKHVDWTELLWIDNMSHAGRSRLRAMRECDPSNLYDYDAPYWKK